ncbi:hypothetical protein DACRYDRAFT_117443 [Dacryopinax primogenitus]|uniref:NUDE domain-containing protein n=1 Tax=Dacryopinax primogenitus (strain DJM 731) TaxID=1858805 RepID=M5G7N3_DACPD|nr:uncharacterized protein DACRYDRAFT_117443 [Dacryopinax primogenitus]EJT99787.1 hypothetical protein DACRYDRAFT_117443 [Dacryopinax primogenitus]
MGGGDDDVPEFDPVSAHPADEWRNMYIDKHNLLEETMEELADFRLTSQEIEQEMEKELKEKEKAVTDLKVRTGKIEIERDDWKNKFMKLQATFNTTTNSLQRELDSLRKMTTEYKTQVRELEMGNDDLERNERYAKSSLTEMEEKFNRVTEEKIILEHELMSKAAQEEELQRLRDELRGTSQSSINAKLPSHSRQMQLETQSSLGPSPATSPSLQGEKEESLLHLDDLTVQQKRMSAMPQSPAVSSTASSPAPTPPPKPYPPLANAKMLRSSPMSNSPSRIPAPRKSMLAESTASAGTVLPRTRSAATQMMGEMRARVKLLENRLNARRAVSNAFSRKKEPVVPEVEGSPGWVVLSDTSSAADSSSSFVKIAPPPPAPTRPLSSASRSSTEYGRGSFDRRRSIDVKSPPTSYISRIPEDVERPRPSSQSSAPWRTSSRPASQLGDSTATIRASETQRFPLRPPTPSFIPKPNAEQADASFDPKASLGGIKATIGRSQSVRRAISTASGPSRTSSKASASRPVSISSVPAAPSIPKGLERSMGMMDISSIPSPSSISSSASRIGRPSSSAVGNVRRPASQQAATRSQTPLGYGSYGSYDRDDEQELGVGSVKEPLPGIGLGRAKAKARIPSGNRT